MNKQGSILIYGFMLAVVIIVLALALAPAVKESTDSARNQTNGDTLGLDCSNVSISNFDKATCIATDMSLFYFIGSLVFIAGAVITAKLVFGGSNG